MKVEQIYDLMNTITTEILGTEARVEEDLSNVVDIGTQIFNATSVDNYVKSLVNHIGKVIFVNRTYTGGAPSVLLDGWEYGSILEKVSATLPQATANESWDLVDGQSYDPNVFYKPTVETKFYNGRVTFEIPISFTEKQVKESFSNAEQLNGFLSMLFNEVEKSLTVKLDALIMRTINYMLASSIQYEYSGGEGDLLPADIAGKLGGTRVVNLLYEYNTKFSTSLNWENALLNPDFVRFATYTIMLYSDRISLISSHFNVEGKERFTPRNLQHMVLLSEFERAAGIYLESDTFHNELVRLPKHEVVPYWQAPANYSFADNSAIEVTIKDSTPDSTGNISTSTITANGIIGVIFDHDALGVANLDRRVTNNYNPKAEFFTNWYKFDAGYFADRSENCIVFICR